MVKIDHLAKLAVIIKVPTSVYVHWDINESTEHVRMVIIRLPSPQIFLMSPHSCAPSKI